MGVERAESYRRVVFGRPSSTKRQRRGHLGCGRHAKGLQRRCKKPAWTARVRACYYFYCKTQ